MNCVPDETAMLYAESELTPAEVTMVEAHLGGCAGCRDRIGLLREESAVLSSVLQAELPSRRMQALAHMGASIAASITIAVPAQWVTVRLGEVGMWANYIAGLPFEVAFRALRMFAPLVVLLAITQIAAPAMTRRSGEGAVVIAGGETIRDSVFATGESVLIEGKIEGNLFMFGRTVEIRGEVDGDVITAGQEVRITGKVTGSVMAAAESITVSGHVSGNVYSAGRNVHVEKGGEVQRDVISGSQTITVEGNILRSLTAGAESAVIAGGVGRGVSFAGERLLVRSPGRIDGDINAVVSDRNNVQVEAGATVVGKTDVRVSEQAGRTRGPSYFWELAVLAGAFLVGWLMLAVFPGFFGGAIQNVLSWANAGFGFVALVVMPVAAVILCITLIGIPLGIATLFAYGTGLYLAKIVVAGYLGRELLGAKNGLPSLLGLLLGLALLQAVFLVPFGGAILRFAVFCLGLGALAVHLRQMRLKN